MSETTREQVAAMTKTEFQAHLSAQGYGYEVVQRKTVVTHKGSVNLSSLTTLPADTKFENAGYVYLSSLTSPIQYRGETLRLKQVDGYTMVIRSLKQKGEIELSSAQYFEGGEIKDMKRSFIATRGEYHAHGETARAAIDDVNFKFMQEHADVAEIVSSIKSKNTVSRHEFRLLTGACRQGVEQFLSEHDISDTLDTLPLTKVLDITSGAYGGARMRELFA